MNAVFIAIMTLLYTMQSFLCRRYSEHYPGKANMASPVFTIFSGGIVALISFTFTGFSFSASPLTILLGLLNAVVLFGYNTCLIKAAQNGPYSILMVFLVAGGIILPSLVSIFAFQEILSAGKIFSILVILIAAYMISRKKEETAFTQKSMFLLACAGLAFFNGTYGALLNIQQRLTSPAEKEEMVAVTYFGAMLISGFFLLLRSPKNFFSAMAQSKKSFIYLLSCSVIIALAINLMVYILPLLNITVLYTFNNAGVLLLSVLFSCIFFKEKLSVLNWIGCTAMCLALIGISIL